MIPEGVERIGRRWFWGCTIESVAIPASVGVIEEEAFWECGRLREVVFQEGIRLVKIPYGCFAKTGVRV